MDEFQNRLETLNNSPIKIRDKIVNQEIKKNLNDREILSRKNLKKMWKTQSIFFNKTKSTKRRRNLFNQNKFIL